MIASLALSSRLNSPPLNSAYRTSSTITTCSGIGPKASLSDDPAGSRSAQARAAIAHARCRARAQATHPSHCCC